MAKEFRDQAKQSVEKLLKIMPNYKPDPINDRPEFIGLVEQVKQEQQIKLQPVAKQSTWERHKKWFMIGGGAVVVVILAVIFWPHGKEDLPTPPDFPGN